MPVSPRGTCHPTCYCTGKEHMVMLAYGCALFVETPLFRVTGLGAVANSPIVTGKLPHVWRYTTYGQTTMVRVRTQGTTKSIKQLS